MNLFTRFMNTLNKSVQDDKGNYATIFSAVMASCFETNNEVQNAVTYPYDTPDTDRHIHEVMDYWYSIKDKYPSLADIDVRLDVINLDEYGTVFKYYLSHMDEAYPEKEEIEKAIAEAIKTCNEFNIKANLSGAGTIARNYKMFADKFQQLAEVKK